MHRAAWQPQQAAVQRLLVVVVLLVVAVAPHGGCAQQRLPPALAAAQRRAAAAGSASAARTDAAGGCSRGAPVQQQQQQQQQLVEAGREPPRLPAFPPQRHLLASQQDAGGGGAADGPRAEAAAAFANLTVGNITGAREMALRKALLQDYDKLSFPWAEYGPAQVLLNVALHKILSVDLYAGIMKAAVWFRLEWDDPRLTWDKRKWNVSKMWFDHPQQGDTEIWQPDIALWNAARPAMYTVSQEPFGVMHTGRVYWTRPGAFVAACNFKGLSAYPFGQVHCTLELGSWSYGPWFVNVTTQGKGFTIGGSVTSGESAVWTEYRIKEVTARRHTYPPYPCCPDESDWPVVLIEVSLERQNLIYMMKVIIPQIILTAVAFSTFWLSPACGERLGLAVTVPLAVAVYDLLTYSQLPVSNKVTLVSAMGMTAFLFSMAVLVENAFVIQLWHYSEATYFKGASVMAATALAYREQLVWVKLLGCIHQLKVELARRQFTSLMGPRSATSRVRPHPAPPKVAAGPASILTRWHDVVTLHQQQHQQQRQQQQQQQCAPSPGTPSTPVAAAAGGGPVAGPPSHPVSLDADTAAWADAGHALPAQQPGDASRGRSDPVDQPAAAAAAAGAAAGAEAAAATGGGPGEDDVPRPARFSVLEKAKTRLLHDLGELEAQLGVEQPDDVGEALLGAASEEQLRSHLDAILASDDRALAKMQRRIRKAFAVFGEDAVVARLHATLAGRAGGNDDSHHHHHHADAGLEDEDDCSDAGSDAGGDDAPHTLHARLALQFTRRWQLLSTIIDQTCRYLFVIGYVAAMFLLVVVMVAREDA